jgi:hypothetical protein
MSVVTGGNADSAPTRSMNASVAWAAGRAGGDDVWVKAAPLAAPRRSRQAALARCLHRVMAGLVPATHERLRRQCSWVAGMKPAMTDESAVSNVPWPC